MTLDFHSIFILRPIKSTSLYLVFCFSVNNWALFSYKVLCVLSVILSDNSIQLYTLWSHSCRRMLYIIYHTHTVLTLININPMHLQILIDNQVYHKTYVKLYILNRKNHRTLDMDATFMYINLSSHWQMLLLSLWFF